MKDKLSRLVTWLKTSNRWVFVLVGSSVLLFTFLVIGVAIVLVFVQSRESKSENSAEISESEIVTPTEPSPSLPIDTTVEDDAPVCTLPRVKFKESAFSIGVPNGWLYEADQGTVSIMQDDTNTTAAFLYTAKLQQDVSASDFLDQFSEIFESTITDVNGTFSTSNIEADSTQASASIDATIGADVMTGKMFVSKSEGFVTLRSYWAPTGEIASQEPLLKEIVDCFARTKLLTPEVLAAAESKETITPDYTPDGFQTYQGAYFTLNKPSDFVVTAETDSGIDLTRSDGNAGFSYAYVTGMEGTYTPLSWAQKALPEFAGIYSLQLGTGRSIPSPINGQVIEEFDFSGSLLGSIPVNGKVTVGIYNTPYVGFGTAYSSAFWGIQVATPAEWGGVQPTLQTIQDSVQITSIGATRANTILPPNRPMESSGSSITSRSSYSDSLEKSSSEKWSDAMRGYETVESPSTGQRYDVPQNSWSSTGPEGPGYYRVLPDDSLELLQ